VDNQPEDVVLDEKGIISRLQHKGLRERLRVILVGLKRK